MSCLYNLIKAYYFPVDPRLNFYVANKLLNEFAVSNQNKICVNGKIPHLSMYMLAAKLFSDV